MNTKILSENARVVIDQYLNFRIGSAVCSIPYFNNKSVGARAQLRAQIGKGSPKDIYDEIENVALTKKINIKTLDSSGLKKLLTDNNIGIDCSGLSYYILNAESQSLGKGQLDKHLSFPLSNGIIGKLRAKIRPVENADVATFAHEKNSKEITVKEARVGDIITMTGGDREHILTLHQIEYQNFIPTILHYTHTVAWPTDGEYDHGVRQATIEILDPNKPLIRQKWIENGKTEAENYTFARAMKSTPTLRRMTFL